MLRGKDKKGQSTLEYLLVLAAIVGVIIFAAATYIKPAVSKSLLNANTAIGKVADKLK